MEILIGIIISIVGIYLTVKLAVWLVKAILKIFPYLLGISVVGLVIYGIIYAIQNRSQTFLGSIISIVIQVLYFGVAFFVLLIASIVISEILKLIKLRWLTLPALIALILTQLALKPEGYDIANPTSFGLATGISISIFLWAAIQFIRIKKNVGFTDAIDSNIMGFYAGMGSAFGFVSLYLLNFPNNLIKYNFNNTIYLNVLVYISLLIAIFSLNKQVSTYVKVKKYIKQNGYSTLNAILAIPLSQETDKEKPIFAEQIILKMKKNKYVYEIGMKKPIYLWSAIYKRVIRELNNGSSFDNIMSVVEKNLSIKLSKDIIESVAKMSGINKSTENIPQRISQEITPILQTNIKNVTKGQDELIEKVKVSPVIKEESSNENPIKNKYGIIESEFMLLRYNIDTHPITTAKPQFKALYYNLLNYMLEDLKGISTCVQAIINEYSQILNLSDDYLKLVDRPLAEKEFKQIAKKEICKLGFLNYRLRDYRFILLLEAFYIRYVLVNKIEYDLINDFCALLNIKEKTKAFIIKYLELLTKDNKVCDAETLLLNCRNKHISATAWPMQRNIYWNALYSDLPKYNVAVCATMSSGKSTFINALLGKDYIPSKNEACTAKITSISDNDRLDSVIGIMFDSNNNRTCRTRINLPLLEEWNNNNEVQKIMLESNLDGIKSNKGVVVIHDTPGTNYSQDESHNNITMEFVKNNPIDMVIYIINAEHASTTDNQILLRQIKAEVIDRQFSEIIFLVNKIDSFDNEKDDDIVLCLEGVKKELVSYGYNNPIVLPISANAARLFKMVLSGQQLSRRETANFKNLFDLFFQGNLDLLKFCNHKHIPDLSIEEVGATITIGNYDYNRKDILIALQRTGIIFIESILDKKINS